MTQYKLSRYSHLLNHRGERVLYHSLKMKLVSIGESEIDINRRAINISRDSELYNILSKEGFICLSDNSDEKLLEIYRNEIQEPYISTAYFFLTKNCNLACKYCFEKQSEVANTKEGIMSIGTFDKGLDFFVRLINLDKERFDERKTIIFYGGEPFHNKVVLYHAIEKIKDYILFGILPQKTKILVVTNGTLLDDNDISFIKKHDVTLTFSLDGDKEASINRVFPDLRTLAWEIATKNFKKCKEIGIDLNVACTLTPQTIERRSEVLDYFINTVEATNIGFNVILDNDIIQLDGDYDNAAADFVSSAYFELTEHNITENRTGRRLQVFEKKHPCLFDCNAAGGRQIAIAPDGSVGICHEHIMDKKHFITDIFDDTFDPAQSSMYKEWQKRSPLYMPECYDCPALGICGGGCVINTERKFTTIHKPDTRFCKQTLSILENILLK